MIIKLGIKDNQISRQIRHHTFDSPNCYRVHELIYKKWDCKTSVNKPSKGIVDNNLN